jgi:Na+-transporting methylmalonyl-CoA/oxaloacetate decarboxylase gamma subunit
MGYVFVSYGRADRPLASILIGFLQSQGCSVWWDNLIPEGKSFDREIEAALMGASCIVVLWSRNSVNSDWVRNEATIGHRRGVLVPVLMDESSPPIPFLLINSIQLLNWSGDLRDRRLTTLRSAVLAFLAKDQSQKHRTDSSSKSPSSVLGAIIVLAVLFLVVVHVSTMEDLRSKARQTRQQYPPSQAPNTANTQEENKGEGDLTKTTRQDNVEPEKAPRFAADGLVILDAALNSTLSDSRTS